MDRFRPGWRERKALRRSPWHFIKVVLIFIIAVLVFYFHYLAYVYLQGSLFENQGISSNSGFGLLPLLISSLSISLVLANIVLYLVPSARNSFEEEAEFNSELSFRVAMPKLIVLVLKYIVPICLCSSFAIMWVSNA